LIYRRLRAQSGGSVGAASTDLKKHRLIARDAKSPYEYAHNTANAEKTALLHRHPDNQRRRGQSAVADIQSGDYLSDKY
jgi:hypothetical protein